MNGSEIAHIQDEARRAALRAAMAACKQVAAVHEDAHEFEASGTADECVAAIRDLLNDPKGGA